ncbi:ArsI/CadI family heavy metal resistance metalloenzyme [Polyangium spumosum]|uniref:Glyoxalase/bleomycin resistance/dioxygenase family protein n=1 Tax=Polyangium spumosum TaxID=889282 RepID=A0A6N7Q4N7_9BACT|nr:ArsI/CadI family heavy metal resistance metalloenzyme [Polyangium spumosum]MRG95821.1 glyoxalase/bleomycin resistance/dioxygenase family protein [Polyangium spumosum]
MNVLKPHVSLNVTNIEQSVAFYEKAFGVAATKRRAGYAKFDLQVPSLNLTMQEAPRTGINVSHFGVQVASTEDVLEAKARFEAQGLKTLTEEETSCCYAVQDKVWVEDPDGNSWEVFVVKADADVMGTSTALNKDASACCTPVGLSEKSEVKSEVKPTASSCCGPKT